jgi:hypothetical protein
MPAWRASWRHHCFQFSELTGTWPRIRWRPLKATQPQSRAIASDEAPLKLPSAEDWKEEEMLEPNLAAALMVGMVILIMAFWRLILIFMLSLAVTVFCFGAYCIVNIIIRLI